MNYKPGFTTKQSAFPFSFLFHVSGKVIFQRNFFPNLSLSPLVLSFSVYFCFSLCYFKLFPHPTFPCFNTFSAPALPLFFPFSFPLNSSFLFTLNVCLHTLILTPLYCALRFSSEMPKISFSLCLRKSCLLMFPPPCLFFGPSTIFIFIPLEKLCPQPFLSSSLLEQSPVSRDGATQFLK